MKILIASLLCAATCFSFSDITTKNYNATFTKGGYFGGFAEEANHTPIVIKTNDEMKQHIQNLINIANITDNVPPEFREAMKEGVKNFYARYNDEFFKHNVLVTALVDRGSGSFKYKILSLNLNDNGLLNISIERTSPLACTMDYVPWTLLLELNNKEYTIKNAKLELIKTQLG